MLRIAVCYFVLAGMLTGATAIAAESDKTPVKKDEKKEDIREQLARRIPGAKPEDVIPAPIPGLYEISVGTSTAYISADGKYLISGDLFEVASKTNMTEARRTVARKKLIDGLKESDLIVFAPAGAVKHTITVFTDVDCGYCRKLHSEIAELNKLGVRVRYAAYPRSGPGTEDWNKMEAVWCAKDRRKALTNAKLGEALPAANCGATPVASQYQLGDSVGVSGTPAIVTESGEFLGGYMPAAKLSAYLEEQKQGKKRGS
jgi:thiol:disulfide interchange protein DsbC